MGNGNVLNFEEEKERLRIAGQKPQQAGSAIPDTPQHRAIRKVVDALEEEGCSLVITAHLKQISPGLYQSVPVAEIKLKG
jgi:hypothetical protein